MRDIKFRGYDKEFEKMTYFDDEEYDYRPPLAFRLDQVFKKDSNYDDYEDFEYKDITEKLEIMQYTGLKDKNGKEIYEGDIVKINDEIIAKVIWDNDYLGYFLYANEENSIDYFENGEQPLYDYLGSIEVIGNIWEDSDLLDDRKNKKIN